MRDNKIIPKKKYGQYFLTSRNLAKLIIDSLELSNEDDVLEIGPGTGILTNELVSRHMKTFKVIEVDRECSLFLRKKYPTLDIINEDVMGIDLNTVHINKVVSNLPYHISSQVLFKLLEMDTKPVKVVLMFQEELANRILSQPGTRDYGYVSVAVQLLSSVTNIKKIHRSLFFPKPNVDSRVLRLDFYKGNHFGVHDFKLFHDVTRAAFRYKRKTFLNNIRLEPSLKSHYHYFESVLKERHFPNNIRAEHLSIKEFVEISNRYGNEIH